MKTVVLDFETYYDKDYSLRKISYAEYILSPKFLVHGMAVDENGKQEWITPDKIKGRLARLKNHVIVCHNAFFDAAVLKWRYKFRPKVLVDTLGLANHVLGSSRDGGGGRNDLDNLAARLGFEGKKRTIDFKGMARLSPIEAAAVAEYAKHDAALTRQIFENLVERVSRPEFELWLLNHTIDLYTSRTLQVNPAKLKKALALVAQRRQTIVAAGRAKPAVLSSNKQFGEELAKRLKRAKIKMPMKKGKNGLIPALAKGDPAFIALTESPSKPVASLVRARLVERSSITVASRIRTMQEYHRLGIGIPVHLVYYGAHTGRFAGGGGFNFQNLTSPARLTDELEREIAASIRDAVEPGEGQVFVSCDAAQIEARVNPWLAGEQHVLDDFAAGVDLYSKFISGVIGQDIHKPAKGEANAEYLTTMRQAGKTAVLGLGFAMGVDKYRFQLRKERSLVPHLGPKGMLNEKVCATVVHGYRKQHPNVVQFWHDLNDAFLAAMRGVETQVGFLTFGRIDGRDVFITLPSGRQLFYRNIRRVPRKGVTEFVGVDGERHVKKREGYEVVHGSGQRVYGGLLAENVTQAVARDVLAEAIYNAEGAGYPVVLHIHDDIVCRVPKKKGEACLTFLNKTLSTAPEWAPGLPLSSEGHVATSLSK